jgi:holo-[acyl-carrier protein] synthase
MLIGVGHDLQRVADVARATALHEPGVFFTEGEAAHAARAKAPAERSAGLFAAKEAFFKALAGAPSAMCWTDIEVAHDRDRRPYYRFHGALARHMAERRLRALLTISHSGEYASAVCVLGTE